MRKGKIGLQKEISRIFTGIQIPKKEGAPATGHPIVPPTHTASPNPHTAPSVPAKTPVPSPSKQPAVHTNSAPAAPAQHIAPKTVQPTPHLFTIPEPPADSASKKLPHTESSVKPPVYETPVVQENVYEPPAINKNDNVYEPPCVPSQPAVENVKIELAPKKQWLDIIFKVINEIKGKLPAPKHGVNSTRQKIMMVLIPVLSVVFIVVLFKVLRSPAVKPPVAPSGKTAGAGTETVGDGKITWEIPAIYPDNLRDPMILGAVSTQSSDNAGKPSVKGIVYSEDHPIAVVGDRIVSVGEVVQGITVVKINPDSVEFSKGDQKWTQEVER